ncbi:MULTISPECIES: methyltransferase domain-containing protein [Acidithiobacillus]|jgi:SAM-dependent methyltransferase|uniref:Methyltransferase type 11 domain-containing protein n=1 Tax=Acidithiobacillus caldus (strain SM-1) TaxID=990288 RepID=F9ZRU0_ACICS|nr:MULTISPECIES: methyltransferase domain-containing protein [Acidithiobacillus]AEK59105.1 conserved hypothetical protein [Acidithiobacillus caldus SM-1]AUW33497.1 methyltransferase domain-containing protein [Acidithiobacillus caldus]MBU2730374.1 methyltransferase domain-containing protein [Acidithiobacillus caldus]MBU2735512.1 methyltransferase domain-containing protein [Acidithiobacillus caldus ATCC 51756]MBU2746162.1 methyltransferase domain-containing protein [Acidithiobacillus caldus]
MPRPRGRRSIPLRRTTLWWSGRTGRLLLERAASFVPAWLEKLRPETVLQVGQPLLWSKPPESKAIWVLLNEGSVCVNTAYLQTLGNCENLPFAAMRFDLVILPFCLSRVSDPAAVLAECRRVLRPEGHVLVLDFNPSGSLGMLRRWHVWRRDRSWPWRRPFLSLGQLRRLLDQEDLMIREGRYFQYTLPGLGRNAQWLELVGDRWWPAGANAYMLLAQRRDAEQPLVGLVEPAFRQRRRRKLRAQAPAAQRLRDDDA